MTTVELEKCLSFLVPLKFQENVLRQGAVTTNKWVNGMFIKPFRKELAFNLAACETFALKLNVIIYYISEFLRVNGNLPDFNEIIIDSKDPIYRLRYIEDRTATDHKKYYSVSRHYLLVLLFIEIQEQCQYYSLPFRKTCRRLNFPLNVIDISPSQHEEENSIYESIINFRDDTQGTIPQTPIFSPDFVQSIFSILKVFFHPQQHEMLYEVLNTGGYLKHPLLFMGSGNKLAISFKHLFDNGYILGCSKKTLENWIRLNFVYRYQNVTKYFTDRYLSDLISSSKILLAKPIRFPFIHISDNE